MARFEGSSSIFDDVTSDPLVDADVAADGTEGSNARKDHVHPRHHAEYTDEQALTAAQAGLDYGLSFQAVVTTATDATHFKASGLTGKGNDFFNGYYVYVVWDADGAGDAPQGEAQPISAYASSDGTFTHPAFTQDLVVTDQTLILHPFIWFLLELKSTNVPADIDTLLTRLTATRAGNLDELDFNLAARLGSPAGASISADIAAIPTTGGLTWADYHYYEALAGAATYTPTAKSQITLFIEGGNMQDGRIHIELWDGSAWMKAYTASANSDTCVISQDTAQSLRIKNGAGFTLKISVTGAIWS